MTTSRDAVLLPCPFCGGSDITWECEDSSCGHTYSCGSCGVSTRHFRKEVDAKGAWNRRAHPEPCDRNAVIEECLSKLHAVVAAIGLDMTGGATISFAKLIDLLNEVRDSLRALKTQPTERAT